MFIINSMGIKDKEAIALQPYVPAYIRNKNRDLVFNLFLEYKELSRADITKLSKISFPTVMKIVDYLLSKNLILESSDTTSLYDNKLGRKGQMLRLNENAYSAVGISFEGKYLRIGLVNLCYELLDHRTLVFDHDVNGIDKLSKNMTDAILELKALHPETTVLGAGIGLSGVVDPVNRAINRHHVFGIYSPVAFDEVFTSFSELPDFNVFIENDVNASCLGELMLRKKEGITDLVYLALGTGLGAGIIIDGELRRGHSFFAGDVGNTLVAYTHDITRKQMSESKIENRINLRAIKNLFGVDVHHDVDVSIEKKQEICDYICSYMVPLIFNMYYVLDVGKFIIAGVTVEFLGNMLFERIDKELALLIEYDEMRPTIKALPTVSNDASMIGGAAITFQKVLPEILNDMPN